MSEPESQLEDGNPNPGARWVAAKVVADEEPAPLPPPAGPNAKPALSEDEVTAARWFSIAFLLIVIPGSFAILGFVIWSLVRAFSQ